MIDGIEIVEGSLEDRIRRQFPGKPNERLLRIVLDQVQKGKMEIFLIGSIMFCHLTKEGAIFKILFQQREKEVNSSTL